MCGCGMSLSSTHRLDSSSSSHASGVSPCASSIFKHFGYHKERNVPSRGSGHHTCKGLYMT